MPKSKVIVSSNCQTEGITEAISIICPEFNTFPIEIKNTTSLDYLPTDLLKETSFLISSDPKCFSETFVSQFRNLKVIRIPQIIFPAFHPDIVYATDKNGNFIKCLNSDYHSALILWGWKNSLSSSKIISLFDKNVFKKLGYFDCWDSSVKELKNRFAKTNIDFTYFWRSVKRYPSFMHSLNHPKVFVISELSKLISLELGMSEHILKEPIHDLLTDKLDAQRWPVYPEIAKNFGITGFYRWKIRKDFYNSLHEFIEMSVESYKQSDFSADEVSFFTEGYQRFNQLLSELK